MILRIELQAPVLKFTFSMKSFWNTLSVKRVGPISGPMKCQSWSGSKLFAKVISRRQEKCNKFPFHMCWLAVQYIKLLHFHVLGWDLIMFIEIENILGCDI